MDEQADHLGWLRDNEMLLQDPAQLTTKQREEIKATCRRILEKNPTSQVAIDTLRKIAEAVQPTATEIKQHEPLTPKELQSLQLLESKILLSHKSLCRIVGVRRVDSPRRLLFCTKQHHGSVEEHRKLLQINHIAGIQEWLRHQNEMIRMQDAVEIASNHGAVYFQEILPDGVNVKGMSAQECANQNQIMVNATKDERIARNLAMSATQQGIDGEQCLQSQMGMTRFIVKLLGRNPKNITRLRGLLYPGRRDYLARREQLQVRPNAQLLQQAFAQDLRDYNAYATKQIIGALPDKGCGFLLTGGTHFEANTDIDELLTWDDTPRNILELMLDKHLYATGQLNDTNIFILEPNHFATVPRFDRTGQLVRPPPPQS